MIYFSTAEQVMRDTLAQLDSFNLNAMFKERDMALDYYSFNNTEKHIQDFFHAEFKADVPLYPQNMTKRLISRISMVYKDRANRLVENDNYYDLIKIKDYRMKNIERVHNLLGSIAVMISTRNGTFEYTPIIQFEPVFDSSDPLNPIGIVYPVNKPTQSMLHKDRVEEFVYWSAEETFRFDNQGKRMTDESNPDMINPYGVLPFVFLQPVTMVDEFWNEGANDIVIANKQLDIAMTLLQYHMRTAGGQMVIEGIVDTEEVRFGPGKAIALENASMSMLPNGADINSIIEGIKFQLQQVAQNHHVTFDFGLNGSKSGVALKIENLELMEAREDEAEKFRFIEHQLYDIERVIAEADYNIALPDNFSVDFAEMDFPDIEREREEWDWKFNHGIADISDYLMENDPDRFPDRQSAEEYLAERKMTQTTVKKLADTEDNLFNIGG